MDQRTGPALERLAHQRHELARVAWRPPSGWVAPDWLDPEPAPASLPMGKDRMRWCLHAIGWSLEELARRVHTHEASIRQMGRGKRDIPEPLALFLEQKASEMLGSALLPAGWRPKRQTDDQAA